MAQRNVHGKWTISFDDRILKTQVTGATNTEAGQLWMEQMQELLFSSLGADAIPWVVLNDCRHWTTGSLEAWEKYNEMLTWMSEHNCIFYAFIFRTTCKSLLRINGLKALIYCITFSITTKLTKPA
ncbi:hypothetical protein L4C34_19395 [Vibrio profundum]|uniref:hypothetical protein n=1 Tax=Vibrio profundum TaxID=2910247 RepID=UPI003D13F055